MNEFESNDKKFRMEFEAHQKAIRTSGAPEVLQQEGEHAQAWSIWRRAEAREGEAKAKSEYDQQYRDWHGEDPAGEPKPSASDTSASNIGQYLLVTTAFGIAWWLVNQTCQPIQNVTAMLLAILMSGATFALAATFLSIHVNSLKKPRTGLDQMHRLMTATGLSWLLVLATVVVMAFLQAKSAETKVQTAFPTLVVMLCLLSAINAAVLGAIQHLQSWGNRSAEQWLAMRDRVQAIGELEREMALLTQRLSTNARRGPRSQTAA